MTSTTGVDAWRIAGEDRAKHDAQFFQLKPVNGFISGDQARGFFMQSGLPTPVLGQIWSLADMNGDGKMDKKEFSIAMHLIKKKLQGYELPKSLPASLKADPSPVMGSFGARMPQPGMAPMGMPAVGMGVPVSMAMGSRMPMMTNGMPGMMGQPGYMGMTAGIAGAPVSGAGFSAPGAVVSKAGAAPGPASGGSMAMPHTSKLKYTQMFNANDSRKRGSLTGVEARAILMQTGVPQQMLAQIWTLSDVDKDGKLDCEEFCIAMHLIDLIKMGQVLPAKLPAELMPGKSRSGSFGTQAPAAAPVPQKDNFGDLLGSMGMPPPVQPTTNGEAKQEEQGSPFTFEDKRKENFDKGQAELERRRQMLADQMKREDEARQEKERKEQEKRERQKQEQEMKRQQELERQLERQRQIEKEREEQRRKMMEQREAARRELDRQRQMEWERQRKEQLLAEKAREYGQLTALKTQSSNLKCELESLQGKKTEIAMKVSQVRNGVTDFTAHIEAMRSTRDLKLTDIEQLQKNLQELTQTLQAVHAEKEKLNLKVQTSVQSNPVSETHRTMMHSVELKKTSVQRLKKDLEHIEKDTETRLSDIDTCNSQITEMNNTISSLQKDISQAEKQKQQSGKKQADEQERIRKEKEKHEKLRKELETQRLKEEAEKKSIEDSGKKADTSSDNWFAFGGDTKTSASSDNWASVFDSQTSNQSSLSNGSVWGTTSVSSSQTTAKTDQSKIKLSGPTVKHKAMYQFDARNEDELSLVPGDIVNVFVDQTGAEPGWKGGEMGGKSGWFPEAYVEKTEEESSQLSSLTSDSGSVGISSSSQLAPTMNSSEDSSFMVVPGKAPAASPTPGQGQAAPEGLHAQALYPWKAKKENHLTFNKGDTIIVREQQDMWWSGELNGKVGWFPKSYVKLVSATAPSATSSLTSSPSLTPTGTLEKKAGSARDSPAIEKPEGGAGEQYQAVYTYTSTEAGDLTFSQGDIILVTKAEGDWWTGSCGNKQGIFPANYVKKIENQQPGQKSSLKKPEIATVIAPYTATGTEQLSLSTGQLIQVRKKSASGWWEGELQARGQKRKIGWFPANYVKLLGSSARSTPDTTLGRGVSPSPATQGSVGSTSDSPAPQAGTPKSATPQPQPASTPPQPQAPKYIDHVIALYPYSAQNDDELTFQKDAVINVVKKDDPDWWQGEYNGQIGMFPSNYVSSTSPPDSTSWSTDPQVLALTSAEEGKRQSYIHELINTEETYMADMSIVLDAFYRPMQDSKAMTEDQLLAVFVNWNELILCNNKLLKALRVRKKMCGIGQVINIIGDILCENIPHMSPYIRFCSCQLSAAALLQRLTENSSLFQEIHKQCVQNPKTKGMPLSSFLLKPMQRITKYPLMVEKILKYTPVGHPDHQYLTDAQEQTTELCSQVNEGVREKENSDRLEWIQQHVHCEGLPEKITFNSGTNCLGPRKVLHTGVLYKAKSNKELAAFLFNDFMLLTTPNRPLGSGTHSLFDGTGQMQYKMYRNPVFLNEVMVKKVGDEDGDSHQFQLSHIDRVFNLKASSTTERDTWVRQIDSASRQYLDTERKKREKAHSSPKSSKGVGRLLVIIMEGCNLASSKDVRRSPGMGRLLVVILEGVDLKASNINGKSDPYCEVSMGAQEHKTKVLNNTLNPKWNASMQFSIRNVEQDTLCITVFDRDLFSPNNFLGRTEIGVKEILSKTGEKERRPVTEHLLLHEVDTGEIVVKLDLHLFDQT